MALQRMEDPHRTNGLVLFEELVQFTEAAQFDRLGVFSYSDEDTSKSYELDAKVDAKSIYNRKRRLMAVQRKISKKRNKALIGREMQVLVEGPAPDTDLLWQGRLASQAPEIDGVVYLNDFGPAVPKPGEMRRVRITEAHDYDLVGELVDGSEPGFRTPQTAGPFIQILPLHREQTAPLSR